MSLLDSTEWSQNNWTHFYYYNNFPLKLHFHTYLKPIPLAYKQNGQLFTRGKEEAVVLVNYGSSFSAVFAQLVSHSWGLLVSEAPSLSSSGTPGGLGISTWSLQSLFSFLLFRQPHIFLLQNLKDNTFFGVLWKGCFGSTFDLEQLRSMILLWYGYHVRLNTFYWPFISPVSQSQHLWRFQENVKVSRQAGDFESFLFW